MEEETLKLPRVRLPKLKPWDLAALGLVVAACAVGAGNLAVALAERVSDTFSATASGAAALVQLAVCLGSLLVLGKTVKEGTAWGNLLAVTGMLAGLAGILLAAALWAAA